MRSSRIATFGLVLLATSLAVVGSGCGGSSDGELSEDDRSAIVRVVAAHAAAEAGGDAAAYCRTLTREHRSFYASLAEGGRAGDTSTDPAGCAAGFRASEREAEAIVDTPGATARERTAYRGILRDRRRYRVRVREAARDRGRYAFSREAGTTSIALRGTAAGTLADQALPLEREDGAWRVGYVPETATLR